jgi:hypothetical protein
MYVTFVLFFFTAAATRAQGAAEKIKRENDVHLRQLAKKNTYLFFFLSAFLGVSRQGEFENTRKKIEYISKKNTGEIFFRRGNFFPGGFVLLLFLSIFCCCVG